MAFTRQHSTTVFCTSLGVRLRQVRRAPGPHSWLFFPGGAGMGSESLLGLATTSDLPGTSWLVDLPGNGSNVNAPGAPSDPYALWPQVLLEAVDAVAAPIAVGHAGGAEQLLCVPELEDRLSGLVLISSAPDSGWMPAFEAMCATSPIPEATAAAEAYDLEPSGAHLRALAVAAAPWSFTADGVEAGRSLLTRLPYSAGAADWSARFERRYISTWWPVSLPTLIVSGREDRVVDQSLWDDPHYTGPHVQRVVVDDAGHFPWVEQAAAVRAALHRLSPLS